MFPALKICWRCRFLLIKYCFLKKFSSFSKFKNYLLRESHNWGGKDIFQEKISFSARLRSLPVLQNSNLIPKKPFFFQKILFLYVFGKSYYFSRILRQICFNLVMKTFQIQNILDIWTFSIRKQTLKKSRVEWMIFLPYYKCGRKMTFLVVEIGIVISCSRIELSLISLIGFSWDITLSNCERSSTNQQNDVELNFTWRF